MTPKYIKVGDHIAEPGVSKRVIELSSEISKLLLPIPAEEALSVLMNVAAIVICNRAFTETAAKEQAKQLGREIARSIEINWPSIKSAPQ